MKIARALGGLLSGLGLLAMIGLGCKRAESPPPAPLPGESAVNHALALHTAEFEKKVYAVTDGVWVAVGFALANSILVEGTDCAFVVDVTGSVDTAREVKAEFDKLVRKPIEALIYTHNHADHVFGGPGFVSDRNVDVYAHETTEAYIDRMVSILRVVITRRSARMFGIYLPETGPDAFVNAGIGPSLEIRSGSRLGLIRPDHTFRDELQTEICGVSVQLVHAAGETNDQIFVWLPEKRVLLPGDNVYKAFPNLYTIRGTLYRDVMQWVHSLDKMRELHARYLVPSHTRPVVGAEKINEILTAYRDAIQYVHDQTIRGINAGLTPDELVETVRLPAHLARHPYLQEFYGTVAWSVRSIFSGYLGWFDGDAATLSRASPDARARGFADLAGGPQALLEAARHELERGHQAWAAELATQLLRLDPGQSDARRIKARALRVLGHRSISPNARNYYLTQARELEGITHIVADNRVEEGVRSVALSIPIGNFLAAMPTHLDPRKSATTDLVVGFRFPDADQSFTIHVRRGVAEIEPVFPEHPNVAITIDSKVWREIVLRLRNPALAFASDAVKLEGSRLDLIRFLRMFD